MQIVGLGLLGQNIGPGQIQVVGLENLVQLDAGNQVRKYIGWVRKNGSGYTQATGLENILAWVDAGSRVRKYIGQVRNIMTGFETLNLVSNDGHIFRARLERTTNTEIQSGQKSQGHGQSWVRNNMALLLDNALTLQISHNFRSYPCTAYFYDSLLPLFNICQQIDTSLRISSVFTGCL